MVRQIIIPTSNIYTLQLPDNLIGKEVEILAFEVVETVTKQLIKNNTNASDIFKNCKVNLSNYKFNRDEANDYE